jgi:site-specific DNA-methyltransferase (adenine-specific)
VARLRELKDNSVDSVVTSPPYWGLRDYFPSTGEGDIFAGQSHRTATQNYTAMGHRTARGYAGPQERRAAEHIGPARPSARLSGTGSPSSPDGSVTGLQLGREPSVEGYLEALGAVFAQLARVLRPSATVWLNLGDTFGGSWGNYVAPGSRARTAAERRASTQGPGRPPQTRCRPKDLQGVPWRAALMLTEQGWRLRAAIVWHKPNARPESVRDRLAQRYEMLFLLSRTHRHWWNPAHPDTTGHLLEPGEALAGLQPVWTISAPRARTGHLAPGPVELARRCLRHGCPPAGIVLDPFCGSATTGVAALELGHQFIGIDLDPGAIAVAKARLAQAAR